MALASEITKKYTNPPLIEAICEFLFEGESRPIEEIEKSFGEAVKDSFPQIKERKSLNFSINQQEGNVTGQANTVKVFTQYINADGNVMVQIGDKLLAVNHLKPYTTWEDFIPKVTDSLGNYLKVSGLVKIKQVSIRYVNKIDLPLEGLNLGDYFKYSLSVPVGIETTLASFLVQAQHVYEQNLLTVSIYTTLADKPDFASFVFDIVYANGTGNITNENLDDFLNKAHLKLNDIFEKSLTDKCKQIFE